MSKLPRMISFNLIFNFSNALGSCDKITRIFYIL